MHHICELTWKHAYVCRLAIAHPENFSNVVRSDMYLLIISPASIDTIAMNTPNLLC